MVLDGARVRVHMFVMQLSHSGKTVHFLALSQSAEAFLECHVRALTALGSWPTSRRQR